MLVDLKYVANKYAYIAGIPQPEWRYNCAIDDGFIREVALWYENAPLRRHDAETEAAYAQFKLETFRQFYELIKAGLRVEPWLTEGQPYERANDLFCRVKKTGKLYVFLTRNGHGDVAESPSRNPRNSGLSAHPMTELTGVRINNSDLMYNDLFRAVHDAFGHIMEQVNFSIEGELLAAREHAQLYTADVHSVLLSETVGQICWFYAGPHLSCGGERRYPPQKTEPMPKRLVDGFFDLFCVSPESWRPPIVPICKWAA